MSQNIHCHSKQEKLGHSKDKLYQQTKQVASSSFSSMSSVKERASMSDMPPLMPAMYFSFRDWFHSICATLLNRCPIALASAAREVSQRTQASRLYLHITAKHEWLQQLCSAVNEESTILLLVYPSLFYSQYHMNDTAKCGHQCGPNPCPFDHIGSSFDLRQLDLAGYSFVLSISFLRPCYKLDIF